MIFNLARIRTVLLWLTVVAQTVVPWASASVIPEPEPLRCINDMEQRKVCFYGLKPRIISISPGVTELLFEAGAGPQVIAVDQNSDYPAKAKRLPKVGGFPNISVEMIAAKKPDLVLWSTGNSAKVISQLEDLKIPTFQLDIRELKELDEALRLLGVVAGTRKQADAAADAFSQRVKALQSRYSSKKPVTVFFEIWRSPLMTVGNDQLIDKVISLCGGENIYRDMNIPIATIGVESLVARNPDVILGSDPRGHTLETIKAMNEYWQQWPSLQAVRKKQMFG